MKTRIAAVSMIAALALAGCSSQSAAEYVQQTDSTALEELSAKVDAAKTQNDETAAQINSQIDDAVATLKAALEAGDAEVLRALMSPDAQQVMDELGTLSAWTGIEGSATIAVDPITAPEITLPEFDDVLASQPEDASKKDAFGDEDYTPTIDGEPYTQWTPASLSAPTSVRGTIQVEGGNDGCVEFVREENEYRVGLGCEGLIVNGTEAGDSVPTEFLTVGERSLEELYENSAPWLLGHYEVKPVAEFAGLISVAEPVDFTTSSPVVVASPEVTKQARAHAQAWVDAQMAMGNDDDRCNYGFGEGEIEVNGVKTKVNWSCHPYDDQTKNKLLYAKFDEVVTAQPIKEASRVSLAVTFTAKEGPVLSVEQEETILGETSVRETTLGGVVVNFDVTEGKTTLKKEGSIEWELNW